MKIIKASGSKAANDDSRNNITVEGELPFISTDAGDGKSEKLFPIADDKFEKRRPAFSELRLSPMTKEQRESDSGAQSEDPLPSEATEEKETDGSAVPAFKLDDPDDSMVDGLWRKLKLRSAKEYLSKVHVGKKNAALVASLVLICGALVANQILLSRDNRNYFDYTDAGAGDNSSYTGATGGGSSQASVNSTEEYFATAAINRQRARDESIEVLELVVNSQDALQESKDSALQSISKIAAQIEQEAKIESLIKAKGFTDCIAVVSDSGATVIVSGDGLLANQIAQITEIICEQTSLPASAINIVEKSAS